jgi:outer membrane protein assembly factor BamB
VALAADLGGWLSAFDDAGVRRWRFQAGAPIELAPAVVGDLVVVAGADGELHGLDAATGRRLWRRKVGGSTPLQLEADAERVRVVMRTGEVHLLDLVQGRPREREEGSPDPGAAHANEGGSLVRRAADGRELWRVPFRPNRFGAEPVLGAGRVAALSDRGELIVLDAATGERLWGWVASADLGVRAPPAIAADGSVYVASLDGSLTALRARRAPEPAPQP